MFDLAWQQFNDAATTFPTTQFHWPEWHKNRPQFVFWGLLLESAALDAKLEAYRKQCQAFLLADYSKAPHITLYAAGFPGEQKNHTDDVTWQEIDRQEQALRALQLRPFIINVGKLNSYPAAPFFEVLDQGELLALHQTLKNLSGQDRDGAYLPHVTMGLYSAAITVETLSPLRECSNETLSIRCDKLSLLAYDAADIRSPLRVLREITLC